MSVWIFSGVIVAAAMAATVARTMKSAILALWVAGFGAGCLYLSLGAEFLAILQWVLSTLIAISFIFFSVMFGEYQPQREAVHPQARFRLVPALSLVAGIVFACVIGVASKEIPQFTGLTPAEGSDLQALGRKMMSDHFLSLEVLALTLFLVLVGGGTIARCDSSSEGEGE